MDTKKPGASWLFTAFLASAIFLSGFNLAAGELFFDFDNPAGNLSAALQSVDALDVPMAVPVLRPKSPDADRPVDGRRLKEWTVMVFANGKNNLSSYFMRDLQAMEQSGSGDKINILMEVGLIREKGGLRGIKLSSPERKTKSGIIIPGRELYAVVSVPEMPESVNWTGVKRFYVTRDKTASSKISSLEVYADPSADMADWKELADFITWGKLNFPAKKYMVVVSNHGLGWEGISADDITRNMMSVQELAKALKETGKVDIYASNACLMQMAEVITELKDGADIIIGSEDVEWGGWDFGPLMGFMSKNPGAGPEKVAKQAVDIFKKVSKKRGTSATLSAVRTSAIDGFIQRVNAWTDAVWQSLLNEKDKDLFALESVTLGLKKARRYSKFESFDLVDVVRGISRFSASRQVTQTGNQLIKYIVRDLVVANATEKIPGKGIAVFIPFRVYDMSYLALRWPRVTGWDKFSRFLGGIVEPQFRDKNKKTAGGD
ncbi:MAG: clostripain-related cysteine peptidase [bacterium]